MPNPAVPGKISAPCKDCPDREPGCWGSCPKYKAFTERNNARQEADRAARRDENNFIRTRSYKQRKWRKEYRKERQL